MDQHLRKLADTGLYGAGLIEVKSPVLVERYNNCLMQLGIEPTRLKRFNIDCIGWSPEIANEKGIRHYLSHGATNQMAVILTPDQSRRPVYYPSHSYERRMIDSFFDTCREQIADITTTSALALAIDQGLSEMASLEDLLHVDHVIIRASAENGCMTAAIEQQALVTRFMDEPGAWCDPELLTAIKTSGENHGDLRSKKLLIPDIRFDDLRSFYSVAFGGAFVIRTDPGIDDLLVAVDKEQLKGRGSKRSVYTLDDPKRLLDRLLDGVVDIDFEWLRRNPDEMARMLECTAAQAVCSADADVDFGRLTHPNRKRLLLANASDQTAIHFELERVKSMVLKGQYPKVSDLSLEARLRLVHPKESLPAWYQKVVWQLICRLTQHDPLRVYSVDKNHFFERYSTWPASMQAWAADMLSRLYVPHNKRRRG